MKNSLSGKTVDEMTGSREALQEAAFPLAFISRLRMATDGAGVTALVGAQGCPLQCRMCLNPKAMRPADKAGVSWVTPDELCGLVRQDDLYYLATGGGVTFGGGEPLCHADFIAAFRAVCPAGWRLYAETSLHVPAEQVRIAACCIDHFFVDIKDMNPAVYRAYTGQVMMPVRENLALLLSLVGADRVTVRVPLIPGFNSEEDRGCPALPCAAWGCGCWTALHTARPPCPLTRSKRHLRKRPPRSHAGTVFSGGFPYFAESHRQAYPVGNPVSPRCTYAPESGRTHRRSRPGSRIPRCRCPAPPSLAAP